VQAEIGLRRGDLDTARAAGKKMASLAADRPIYPEDMWVIALAAEADGRLDEALKALEEPLNGLAAGRYFIGVPHHDDLSRLVSLAIRAGNPTSAEIVAAAAAALADHNPEVPTIAGTAAHAMGLLERSERHLRHAVDLLSPGPRPLATAAAMEDLADALEHQGEGEEAIGVRQAANDIYSRVGATQDAARVQAGLHRLGVHHHKRAPQVRDGWESLSPAELSVVRVVAEGVTSQAAAERLYLSANTVNTHLRHAFAKLGVRSRTELTRVVLDRDRPPTS